MMYPYYYTIKTSLKLPLRSADASARNIRQSLSRINKKHVPSYLSPRIEHSVG